MDQRGFQGQGYGNPGEMNDDDWSVRENQGSQLNPRNSDYQVRADGPPFPRRLNLSEYAGRDTVHPRHLQTFNAYHDRQRLLRASQRLAAPQRSSSQQQQCPPGVLCPRHLNAAYQASVRNDAAPVDSSQASSSRGSIIEKKKKAKKSISDRNPTPAPARTPRAPQSVAAPVDSRSSLSSASGSISEESSRRGRKMKKVKKGSKKDKKKTPQKRSPGHCGSKRFSGRKSVRFGTNNSGSSRKGSKHPIDLARRYAELVARENSIKGEELYNGYITPNMDGGYLDLTSSQDEPGFFIKVPASMMMRALEIADPGSFDRTLNVQFIHRGCPRTPRPPASPFEVYVDTPEAQPDENRRSSLQAGTFIRRSQHQKNGSRHSSQRRGS